MQDGEKKIVHAYEFGEETGCLYFPEPEDLVADDWMVVRDTEEDETQPILLFIAVVLFMLGGGC